jgi:hypothetical protein
MRTSLWALAASVLLMGYAFLSYGGEQKNEMDKIYMDESHCLVASEIRSEKDSSISCFCRDAIVDARYLYQTYLLTGKDKNLNGAYLGLVDRAERTCGEKYDIYNATQAAGWLWEGPQVKREYPPDVEILKIKPDNIRIPSRGIQSSPYVF